MSDLDGELLGCPPALVAIALGVKGTTDFSATDHPSEIKRGLDSLRAACAALGAHFVVVRHRGRGRIQLTIMRWVIALYQALLFVPLSITKAAMWRRLRARGVSGVMLTTCPITHWYAVPDASALSIARAALGRPRVVSVDVCVARSARDALSLADSMATTPPSAQPPPELHAQSGRFFGYPSCCAREFVRQAKKGFVRQAKILSALSGRRPLLPLYEFPPLASLPLDTPFPLREVPAVERWLKTGADGGCPPRKRAYPRPLERYLWHAPCSEGCAASRRIAAEVRRILRRCYGIR